MSNNKITHLANPAANGDAINKSYVDTNFSKLSGGTVTGHIIFANHVLASQDQAISCNTGLLQWTDLLTDCIALNSIGDLDT